MLSQGGRCLNVHGASHCLNVKEEYRRSKGHSQSPELTWLTLRLCLRARAGLSLTHKGVSPALYQNCHKAGIVLYSLTSRILWPFEGSFSLYSSKFTIGGGSVKRLKTFDYKNRIQNLGMRMRNKQ